MKKLITLLLVLTLCLSLTACASKEEKAFVEALEAADALMASGDYAGAIEAYTALPVYADITERIAKADEQIRAESLKEASFLVGTWMDLHSGCTMIIDADGTFKTSFDGEYSDALYYSFEDNTLYAVDTLAITEADGVTHLTSESFDFVSEADYEVLGPKFVDITLENWETYLELREARHVYLNGFGEVEGVCYGYGIFLRDEYAQKLASRQEVTGVSFKVQYDEEFHHIVGDFPNGEYSLGDAYVDPYYQYTPQEQVMEVYYYGDDMHRQSDFYGHYVADYAFGYVNTWNNDTYALCPVNLQVIDVSGSLYLFP